MTETIIKYYCDRCKKEMPEDRGHMITETSPKTSIEILGVNDWYKADLCTKCKGSFAEWWNK